MARQNYLFTSESVSEGHPDKVCDRISDEVVDLFFREGPKHGFDPWQLRVACETLCTTNRIVIAGETRGPAAITFAMVEDVARKAVRDIGYEPQIADWLNEFKTGQHYKDLSVEELRGLHDSLRSIEATAKNFQEVKRRGQTIALNEAVQDLAAKMDEHGQRFTKNDLINPPDAKVDGLWAAVTHWAGVRLRMVDADLLPQEFKINR